MKLYVDLESLQLIEGPGFRNPVTALRFKRGDAAQLEVTFLEGGTMVATIGDPDLLELRFGVKPRNRYDIGYLVQSDAWSLPAPDAEALNDGEFALGASGYGIRGGTTGSITDGLTEAITAPANTTTPVGWLEIRINGTLFKIPLFQ